MKKQQVLCLVIFLVLLTDPTSTQDPFRIIQSISRLFRQGDRYEESRNADIPAKVIEQQGVYDFIIIGAGSAGSVVANRLSDNPLWNVLLLEAGKEEVFFNDIPMMSIYLQGTDYNWGYSLEPQETCCLAMEDRRCRWPRGKSLGGTSSINDMIYSRGNKLDYDQWADMGNTGWSYEDVLPYFKKSENIEIPELFKSKYHSTGGYLNVESVPYRTPLAEAFLLAGEELGYERVDYNGEKQVGFSYNQGTLRNGSRCSASKAFLRPVRERSNLHVSLNTRVSKIIVDPDSMQVVEVEFIKNRAVHRVRVSKEVVLSAGTLNSPQILMLSGIGPQEHLQSIGIPVLVDLPVGQNLQDHVGFVGLNVIVNESVGLLEERLMRPENITKSLSEFLFFGKGPLTLLSGAECVSFVRTKYAPDERPDVELMFISLSILSQSRENRVLRKEIGLDENFYKEVFSKYANRDSFMIVPILLHPRSRGEVKLKDDNVFHWPKFYGNFLTDPHDVLTLLEAVKLGLKLIQTEQFQKYGSTLNPTPIPGCRQFEYGSDDYWICAMRYLTIMVHHQSGTCKMGPSSDPDAVVDPQLKVYGVKGLRVVDASIIPLVPTGHTNAIAIMIGEKAADLIKADW